MQRYLLMCFVLFSGLVNSLSAYKQKDLDKFLKTGQCNYCDLSKVDFSQYAQNINELQNQLQKKGKRLEIGASSLDDTTFGNTNWNKALIQYNRFLRTDLSGADFSNAQLTGNSFDNTCMNNTNLSGATVSYGTMNSVQGKNTNFENACLRGIHIRRTLFYNPKVESLSLKGNNVNYMGYLNNPVGFSITDRFSVEKTDACGKVLDYRVLAIPLGLAIYYLFP